MGKLTYATRANQEIIDELYHSYQADPESVDPQWTYFFEGVEFSKGGSTSADTSGFSEKEFGVFQLIKNYREYGHLKAQIDPLKLRAINNGPFELSRFGLDEKDLESDYRVAERIGLSATKLKDIIQKLEETYCGALTAQIAECRPEVREWFQDQLESPAFKIEADQKKKVFQQLAKTESLEKFIHTRYVGTKRFSIEGGDCLIPMLEFLSDKCGAGGVEELVIGMAHRGRINVLANFMEKGLEIIFSEFNGTGLDAVDFDGDVKYHLGYSVDKESSSGQPVHVSLAFNPSHLEAVNPVVLGMTRAKQRHRNDMEDRKKVIPILIHGDAAFAGQGVVGETLQMSKLPGYTVGGTIHIIINNQIGFTTNPSDSRSTIYASDVSKTIKAPVLLVNGDDPEACLRAMNLALSFRQKFKEDVVIDLICYRRFGHNEGDEPAFTQPLMYDLIKKHPTPMSIYSSQIEKEGLLSGEESKNFLKEKMDNLQKIFDEVKVNPPETQWNSFGGKWQGLRRGSIEDFDRSPDTAASEGHVTRVLEVLTTEPDKIQLHSKVKKLIANRKKMVENDSLDWAMGELLSYGTLCLENTPVRLSGQDCERGTFTHRQSVYNDIKSGENHCPLAKLNPSQGEFVVYNSLLSEMAVLGFEYGNSCSDPTFLTIWEAQFGDFANGAQIIIDQFLSSGEEKWMRSTGLVLLLPHGYEGQGPEHSSARLERFLQLCAQANMQVCNISTPANFFHLLRRQVRREFRKPLVVMSPKSLLRHPQVVSPLKDFTTGAFSEAIDDPKEPVHEGTETLVLCSGKLFYDLATHRENENLKAPELSLIRLEQLYPFPRVQLAEILQVSKKLKRIVWAQEEPQNMGAYFYIFPKIYRLLDEIGLQKIEVRGVSRPEKASPATGSPKVHAKEQQEIIDRVFTK